MEQSTRFYGEPHMKLVPQGIILVYGWERRELKHLSNARNINHRDSVSSGERKRKSLNLCVAQEISKFKASNSK
jgi:hypothetical protein